MKFNLKNFYFRNKQVLLFLGAVFLGVMIFISFYKIKEGFDNSSIGEYAYLAPVPANNTWSQATQDAFLPIYKKNFKDSGISGELNIVDIMKNATEEEAQYFISNSKFPWGSYITNTYTNLAKKVFPDVEKVVQAVKSVGSTRILYKEGIEPTESKQTPQPLSYQIYMGTAQPPADASSASSVYSLTGLSTTDFQSLTSICKNVLGQR